jgi:hypothetical protein
MDTAISFDRNQNGTLKLVIPRLEILSRELGAEGRHETRAELDTIIARYLTQIEPHNKAKQGCAPSKDATKKYGREVTLAEAKAIRLQEQADQAAADWRESEEKGAAAKASLLVLKNGLETDCEAFAEANNL